MSETSDPGLNLHGPNRAGASQFLTPVDQLGDSQCWNRQKLHLFFVILPSLFSLLPLPVQ